MTPSERTDRYEELMRDARCPQRQRARKPDLTLATPWNETLTLLKQQQGTGFLICLHGPRGTGKTQLGVEMLRYCSMLDAPVTSLYILIMDLLIDLKATFGKEGVGTERDVLERLVRPKLLVIDEVCERQNGDWDSRTLTYVVDRRYAAMRDTLLIANGSEGDVAASLGPSIVSRINECGGMRECAWKSWR